MTYSDEVAAYLETLDAAQLRKRLLETAHAWPEVWQRLATLARAAHNPALQELRALIRHSLTLDHGGYWADEGEYALRVGDVASLLHERVANTDADAGPHLIEIIEEAIETAESGLERVHESSCALDEEIRDLHRAHVAACAAFGADPAELGRALLQRQLRDNWGYLDAVVPDYLNLTGETGRAAYRQALTAAWEALPQLRAGESGSQSSRYTIENLMEKQVAESDDLDTLIRLKSKNLSHWNRYLDLARLCRSHGRIDAAIEWIESGMNIFAADRADPLAKLAIELHLERGDSARVEALAWQRFEQTPGTDTFFDLVKVGKSIDRGVPLREKALDLLWSRVREQESQRVRPNANLARDHLVEIFLREGDTAATWEVFCCGPVSIALWQRVAEARAKTHHEHAIMVYHRLLPHAIEGDGGRARYEWASQIVGTIRQLREQHGQLTLFHEELAAIRREWKLKRNFIKAIAGL